MTFVSGLVGSTCVPVGISLVSWARRLPAEPQPEKDALWPPPHCHQRPAMSPSQAGASPRPSDGPRSALCGAHASSSNPSWPGTSLVKPSGAPLGGTGGSDPALLRPRLRPRCPSHPPPCPTLPCPPSLRRVPPQAPLPGVTVPEYAWPRLPPPHQTRQIKWPLLEKPPSPPVQSHQPPPRMCHVTVPLLTGFFMV